MKKTVKMLTVMALIAILISARDASALVVFDQPFDPGLAGAFSNSGGQEWQDDFTLPVDAFITGITWFGYYFGSDLVSSEASINFRLRFFDDDSGLPGVVIYDSTASAQVQTTGQQVESGLSTGQMIYQYVYDGLPQIPILAGEKAWVSVAEYDRLTEDIGATQWLWCYSTLGPGGAWDNAFTLEDNTTDPIPEPGTILLLGSGLVGLAGFRRKYRKP
jgi:hypothetical protein